MCNSHFGDGAQNIENKKNINHRKTVYLLFTSIFATLEIAFYIHLPATNQFD